MITKDDDKHQNLVTDVEEKIESMGFMMKPKKCRSLSIKKGKIVNIPFYLQDRERGEAVTIASVVDKPLRFLGSEVTSDNSPHAMYAAIFSKLKDI